MSWLALAPTIFIAVIIGGLVLVKPGAARGKKDGEAASSSDLMPTFATSIRDGRSILATTRQPVLPVDYADLTRRAKRGLKVAGVLVIFALFAVADTVTDKNFILIEVLLAALPITAIGMAISFVHTMVLRMLPHRGLIVATALGALLGVVASLLLRGPDLPHPAVVKASAIYGFIIGIMDWGVKFAPRSVDDRH